MKIYFTIEAGLLNRRSVRTQLNNAKNKLEFWYPKCEVLLVEDKGLFESEFYFEANKLPDSAKKHMQDWLDRMKKISQDY